MTKPSDMQIAQYFMGLKKSYAEQRKPLEYNWTQARAAYFGDDQLDKIYNGMSTIRVPIMDWKVNGIVSRINRIILNVTPIGRFESLRLRETTDKNVIDLWNKFVFEYQLGQISFAENFKLFVRDKTLLGTAVAKITQEFEVSDFSYFPGEEEPTVVRDNTYLRPILLEEFYSDIAKPNINDSEACIHSTTVHISELKGNTKVYKNLDLIEPVGTNLTAEQEEYLQFMGVTKAAKAQFSKHLKETRKTGFVQIDECYGRFDLNGDGKEIEVLVTIANNAVVIRAEETPFRHKRYVRPFLIGRNVPIANFLYGESKVVKSLELLYELNASRNQATDAKTRSISPMWWRDMSNGTINWNGNWTPDGIISGMGSNPGITPLLNPYLGHITIQDSSIIERDIDKIWNLSPVQEGSANRTQLPETFRGTAAVIAQNDMPLNDIIGQTSKELEIFFEMLFERNLTFKTADDLLKVWTEDQIAQAGFSDNVSMRDMIFEAGVKILGNMELSNELAQQQGYSRFLEWASTIPPVVRRLDWKAVSKKMLKSFGINEDADDIWLPDEIVQEIAQAESEALAQDQQSKTEAELGMHEAKTAIDTEAKIVEMGAEAQIENVTGKKVQ